MSEVLLNDWAQFESATTRLLEAFDNSRARKEVAISQPLFRGQSDAHWPLRTTLERFSTKMWSVREYLDAVLDVWPAVVSLTGREWSIPLGNAEIDERLEGAPPAYDFMTITASHRLCWTGRARRTLRRSSRSNPARMTTARRWRSTRSKNTRVMRRVGIPTTLASLGLARTL